MSFPPGSSLGEAIPIDERNTVMTTLTGQVALITGSTRGIGKAIAQRYAAPGASVVVNHSGDEDNAERTVEEIEAAGGRAIGAGVFTDLSEDDPFSPMDRQFRPLGGRLGTPEDVADAAEYLAGDLARWVSGQSLVVTGGATQ